MEKIINKPYHQAESEVWECMSETEREEYWAFLTAHPELENEIENCDRRYKRKHVSMSGDKLWEESHDMGEVLKLTQTKRKRGNEPRGPDFLDMIEEAACYRNGEEHYRDPLIRQAAQALSEKQRKAMEYTVIYEIPTAKLAKAWGCNERNVRKLRERALHNLCEHYAAALKKKPGLTLAEREFMEWYDARRAAKYPPVREKKRQPKAMPRKGYNAEYGQFAVSVPMMIKELLTV